MQRRSAGSTLKAASGTFQNLPADGKNRPAVFVGNGRPRWFASERSARAAQPMPSERRVISLLTRPEGYRQPQQVKVHRIKQEMQLVQSGVPVEKVRSPPM